MNILLLPIYILLYMNRLQAHMFLFHFTRLYKRGLGILECWFYFPSHLQSTWIKKGEKIFSFNSTLFILVSDKLWGSLTDSNYKRYFITDQQIGRQCVPFRECLYPSIPFYATQMINPFLTSRIWAYPD